MNDWRLWRAGNGACFARARDVFRIPGPSFSAARCFDKEVNELLRKLAVVATVLSLLGLSVSILSPAVSDSRYEERTIRLADKFSDDVESEIDVGEAGFGVGDYFVFGNDPVFNRARTKQ